jgi:hypothetical protein
MTRVNQAHSHAALATPDSAEHRASTSHAPRASRSKSGSPLASPGAPGTSAPKSSAGEGNRIRVATTRIFDDHSASVKVADLPVQAEGAHAGSPRKTAEVVGFVTTTLEKMKQGDVQARLPGALADKLTTGHWMSDSHFHPTNYTQQGMVPREMLKMMDQVGIHRSVMSPIPTDVMPCGSHGDHNHIPAESYYVPAQFANIKPHELTAEVEQTIKGSAHLMLNQQVDADTALFMNISKLSEAERDRLDPMVTGLHLGAGCCTTFAWTEPYAPPPRANVRRRPSCASCATGWRPAGGGERCLVLRGVSWGFAGRDRLGRGSRAWR